LSKSKPQKKDEETASIKTLARNRQALHQYEILDSWECGMVLTGTEVKSLRENPSQIHQAFARVENDEVWLHGAEIPEYAMGHQLNHKPKRARKLLLHGREISDITTRVTVKGLTLVPLELYFKDGIAKIRIALAKGKKLHDKRETLKKAEASREISREMKSRSQGDRRGKIERRSKGDRRSK
jgi:SsrA-binding protein